LHHKINESRKPQASPSRCNTHHRTATYSQCKFGKETGGRRRKGSRTAEKGRERGNEIRREVGIRGKRGEEREGTRREEMGEEGG